MTTYTDVFGGANIYPSEITYSALPLAANAQLAWPEETSSGGPYATRIIDLNASAAGLSVRLPPANATSDGQTILFNNVGPNTVTVLNFLGTQVVTVAPGTLWQIYLTDNTTAAGAWQVLQYGAATSTANASALAGTGIVAVGTLLSQSVPITQLNSNYSAGPNDRARMFNWTGASGVVTLAAATALGENWFTYVRNSGTGALVVDPTGTALIDGAPALSFQPGESAIVVCDGVNFVTVGFGQSATFAFDYTAINVSGSGNYQLVGTELNRIAYGFTGTLTGTRNIIVPATVQQYWVSNLTTGPYDFFVKTLSGTGVRVNQGTRAILYCDGNNVVTADTNGLSVPVEVDEGGTGSTTAAGARINLGATSVGDALFTAVSQNAAWAALGTAPVDVVNGGAF